ncbi:SRPBCC family protein [Ramlibacter tataouinensis]|uniref:Activator of Hsp90 ATPase homologue 1/2-like C-terminal domain-containing protein n=1 Tax=Ramlibacter tataouinensis (strain ATCC BAA-407 / DSM 14655 / LMG 21543 / TTB310) TaxID=365046 RepID=F5XZ74_RAMTT|nr:SRPBCC family protein [Ramlibacter tataouinensis]AEG93244.1 Conserved hypothetical protein [Ramlibacter tataouinensis TTB310]
MTQASAAHTSFVIERSFAAPPAAVFTAWSDLESKRQWSDCHAENTVEFSLDFRPLGRETHRVAHPEHGDQVVEKVFFDIRVDRRIVFGYDITVNGQRLSVSLVTVEFTPTSTGTRMIYTEQIAYLDGHHDLEQRIHGTGEGLDRLRLHVEAYRGVVQ